MFLKKYGVCLKKRLKVFLSNRFRGKNDLNLATFFVPYAMYLEGKSVLTPEICYYFNIRSANAKAQYKKLLQKKREWK